MPEAVEKKEAPVSPPEPVPIRSTKFRRALTIIGIELAYRLRYSGPTTVTRISPGKCVKHSRYLDPSEAATMEYIRAHTSIPVPKVYCAFRRKGVTYLVMEYIRGKPLFRAWGLASEERREGWRQQIKKMVQELRAVPNPNPGRVAGLSGGPIYDDRFVDYPGTSFGPFENAQAYHLYLRAKLTLADLQRDKPIDPDRLEWCEEMVRMMTLQDRKEYDTVLTHPDFHCFNIIVNGDKVAAIIDWVGAGWYPDYWQFTSAWHGNLYTDAFWKQETAGLLEGDKYPVELEMDIIRHRHCERIY